MNCLKCEKEILITKVYENGSGWMKLGEKKKIMHDGENEYVLCTYCGGPPSKEARSLLIIF